MLSEYQKFVLLFFLVKQGKHGHVPIQAIPFPKRFSGNVKKLKKEIKALCKLGLLYKHPTAGEMTYQLTQRGWHIAKEIYRTER